MEFLQNRKLFIRKVDLGVSVFFGVQKADLLKALQFALYIAGVFFDKLSKTPDVRLEIGVLGIDHNNLTPHS